MNTLTSAQLQLRFAWQLLKGSRWNLVAAFAKQKAELDQQVVVYSSDLRAVDPQAEVPWPVKLLLTMRGPKFLFGGTALPSEQRVRQGLAGFRRRLRTGAMLGTGGGSYNHELYCPNEAWQPRRCSGPAEASMDAFEEEVARRLGEEQARLAAAKQRGNWTPLDCLAFQKMKQLGWSAVKSDKDSSFVLLKVSDREAELRRLLRDPEHFELAATTPAELFRLDRTVLAAYKAAVGEVLRCKAWTDLAGGRERLQRFLLSRAKPPYSCTSRLEFNLKTHKRPIVPRELEGAQRNYLQPGQKFCSFVLRRLLARSAPWVVQDGAEFVRRAEGGEFQVPEGCKLYSGDIKNFFPSCEHGGLVAAQDRLLASSGCLPAARKAFVDLGKLLLDSQFAYAPEVEGFHKRKKGAAMGASQAAEACDAYVALNHDQTFVGPERPPGLQWFVRFRDDCLFCAREENMSPTHVQRLQQSFASRGSQLRLEVAELDSGGAVWLDLAIAVRPDGKLSFRTHIKPTNLGQYIAADSYHSQATLANWPKAELLRYAKNSTEWEDVLPPVLRLHRCLQNRMYAAELNQMLQFAWQMWQKRRQLLQPAGKRQSHRSTVLVLPFHRCWQRLGVRDLLRRLDSELEAAGVDRRPLQLAFSNPFPHLFVRVRNLHKT